MAASRAVDYGSTDVTDPTIEVEEDGRSSSISTTIRSTIRHSIVVIAGHTKEALHSHTLSTLALCTSVFSMIYTLMSAFPYSGFMAMQLVPHLSHQSAGTYAGIISGSFMMGRLFSAWPLGVLCDTYGRKFVLLFSTISQGLFVLAFGFSSTFTFAVAIRFLMGVFNGTMVAARVSVTELAKGDHALEAKGMGLVMSMVGFGMLFGPALGGLLSEPISQYPNFDFGIMEGMLTKYPFVLPNIAGAIFSFMSAILIALSVEETLPPEQMRSPKYIVTDTLRFIATVPGMLRKCWSSNEYDHIEDTATEECSNTDHEEEGEDDSIEEDLKVLHLRFGDMGDAVVCGRESRASFIEALHRPSALARAASTKSTITEVPEEHVSHNIASLMKNDRVRECLSCYWMTTLASTAAGECFPLFAMAKVGGLGIEETAIGLIGAGSGLLFVGCQYFIFAASMKKLGLHMTMISSSLLAVTPVVLIPFSLLFKERTTAMTVYLSALNGIMLVAFSNWNAALTIAQNRAVEPSDRARLNALAAMGASVGRGGGPMFAGALVTFSYTSGIIPAQLGSLIVYGVVAALGIIAFVMNSKLEDEDKIIH